MPADRREDEERWAVSGQLDLVTLGEALVQLNATSTGPLRHVHWFEKHAAGSELNTAIAAARLGLRAGWIGKLGHDEFGEFVLACARAEGVDVSGVVTSAAGPTGLFFVQRGFPWPGSSSSIYYRHGSAGSLLEAGELDVDHLSSARALHFTGISLAVSPQLRAACWEALETVRGSGGLVSFDVNFRRKLWDADAARPEIEAVLPHVDVVFCGLADATTLFDAASTEEALQALRARGPSRVVVTNGPDSALLAVGDRVVRGTTVPVPVVDSTGAGDALAATVLAGLLRGWDPEETIRRACIVGSMVCAVLGDYEGVPSSEQLAAIQGATWVAR
jgi:sugar/nucleoside kinase (ribokinase family)